MKTEPETLESVGRLIALKRHEQPPPGYFDHLPRKIITRIELEQINVHSSIWDRILTGITIKPAFAYAFGVAACGSLIFAVGYLSQIEPDPVMALPSPGTWDVAPVVQNHDLRHGGLSIAPAMENSSTNPVIMTEPLRPLFDGLQLRTEPASYSP